MKKLLLILITAITLMFSATVDTTKFHGLAKETDTLVGVDTVYHDYQIFWEDFQAATTVTISYAMYDSTTLYFYESNDASLFGWHNTTKIDSTGIAAWDSTITLAPKGVNWIRIREVCRGDSSIVKYILKMKRD